MTFFTLEILCLCLSSFLIIKQQKRRADLSKFARVPCVLLMMTTINNIVTHLAEPEQNFFFLDTFQVDLSGNNTLLYSVASAASEFNIPSQFLQCHLITLIHTAVFISVFFFFLFFGESRSTKKRYQNFFNYSNSVSVVDDDQKFEPEPHARFNFFHFLSWLFAFFLYRINIWFIPSILPAILFFLFFFFFPYNNIRKRCMSCDCCRWRSTFIDKFENEVESFFS